jgi:hypothetical protein
MFARLVARAKFGYKNEVLQAVKAMDAHDNAEEFVNACQRFRGLEVPGRLSGLRNIPKA